IALLVKGGPMSVNKAATIVTLIASIVEMLSLTMPGSAQPIPITKVLTVNRPAFVVGEQTVYAIRGAAPNSLILWSSWKDAISTGEGDAWYQQRTDVFGNWSAVSSSWTQTSIGLWKKQVKVGGQIYAATFQVQPRPLPDFADKAGQYFWTPPKNSPLT